MKLKALFMEEPVDFEKRCRLRILVGKTAAVLPLDVTCCTEEAFGLM